MSTLRRAQQDLCQSTTKQYCIRIAHLLLSAYPVLRGESGAPVQAMWKVARWYCQQGLMVGTIFREVLIDLQREGLSGDARQMEGMLWEVTLIRD